MSTENSSKSQGVTRTAPSGSSSASGSSASPSPKPDAYRKGVAGALQKGAEIKARNAEETKRHNAQVPQNTTSGGSGGRASSGSGAAASGRTGQQSTVPKAAVSDNSTKSAGAARTAPKGTSTAASAGDPPPKSDPYRRGVEGAQKKGAAIKARNAEETRKHNERVDQLKKGEPTKKPSTGAGENKTADPRSVTDRNRKP